MSVEEAQNFQPKIIFPDEKPIFLLNCYSFGKSKKSSSLKTVSTILVSIAFAALLCGLHLKGLDFTNIKASLAKANYLWVLPVWFLGLLAYWFRAVRWNLLLRTYGYQISNSNSLWTISFRYLMNLTIPRSGGISTSTIYMV